MRDRAADDAFPDEDSFEEVLNSQLTQSGAAAPVVANPPAHNVLPTIGENRSEQQASVPARPVFSNSVNPHIPAALGVAAEPNPAIAQKNSAPVDAAPISDASVNAAPVNAAPVNAAPVKLFPVLNADKESQLQSFDSTGGDTAIELETDDLTTDNNIRGQQQRVTNAGRDKAAPGYKEIQPVTRNQSNEVIPDQEFTTSKPSVFADFRLPQTSMSGIPESAGHFAILSASSDVPPHSVQQGAAARLPVTEQIIAALHDGAWLTETSDNVVRRISVDLDPPELGALRIAIERTDRGLEVRIEANERVTLEMLASRSPEIERLLRHKDVDVHRVDISQLEREESQSRFGQPDPRSDAQQSHESESDRSKIRSPVRTTINDEPTQSTVRIGRVGYVNFRA